MKSKIELAVRLFLGLILAVFGLNKFFPFMPQPDPPAAGGAYLGALASTGYIFPLLAVVFLIVAVLLFIKKAVPFALILLAPLIVNIVLYHLKFDPSIQGIAPGALIGILTVTLAWFHRDRFASLLK